MFKKIILSLTMLLAITSHTLSYPCTVSAHPLDEIGRINIYDQKQIIGISSGGSSLRIEFTFYATDKVRVWESIDTNRDRNLSEDEKADWMHRGEDASWLEYAGNKYPFTARRMEIPGYYDFFDTKPANVAIDFSSTLNAQPDADIIYHYSGKDKKLSEITYELKTGNDLTLQNVHLADSDSLSFKVIKGSGATIKPMGLQTSDRLNGFLNRYLKADKIPPLLVLIAMLTAFFIGMLHALTPGHGKAIVAGYLVGEKGTISHAIQLGLIITVTHTASVFILGFIAMFLTRFILPATIIKALTFISGFLIVAFGLFLLVKRVRELIIEKHHGTFHDHHHPHSHAVEHHHHNDYEITWKNLLPLGVSGGLIPCVDALAILIVAVSLGKILFGLILLVLFSLGLAFTLTSAGIIVVTAKGKLINKFPLLEKGSKYFSVVSAIIVIILGLAILSQRPI